MRISLSLFILALLFSIPGKTSTTIYNSPMEISNALPVQFWLTGCATYNEHFPDGVHHKCFCAPWECDDEILIQFKDDPSQNFSLLVYDESEENLLDTIAIDEVQVGVYQLAYIPEGDGSPDVCDTKIKLKIRRDQGLQGVSLPALSLWANSGGSGDPWNLSSTPNVSNTFLGSSSEELYADFAFIPGVTYNITVNFSCSNSVLGLFTVAVTDGSFVTQFSQTTSGGSSGDNVANTLSFTATYSTTRITISLSFSASTNTTTITSVEGQRTVGDSEIVAKTDCLDIQNSHENTVLLTYSNVRNFAGLVFSGTSPDVTFQIRIPAIFFHQRFPEEDEVIELSSELVTLNGTVRKQRLLDVDYAPYYFHEKLKLILKHQILTIFNRQWVKQEAYDVTEGDRRWPVKKAKCWISEKDFVHRNIL